MADKKYAVIDIAELNNIDYSQVNETSAETVFKNIVGDLFIVNWEGDTPSSISNLETTPEIHI